MGDDPDEGVWDDDFGRTPREDPSKFSTRVQHEMARIHGNTFNGEEYDGINPQDAEDIDYYHGDIDGTSQANQRNHLRHLRILSQEIEGRLLDHDAKALSKTLKSMERERGWESKGTRRNYAISLAAFLRANGKEDIADGVQIPKYGKNEEKVDEDNVLTPEEIQDLIDATRRPRDAAIVSTLWETANRVTTISTLTVSDFQRVNDTHALITIPSDIEGDKKAGGFVKPVVESRGYIDSWLSNGHPCPEDSDAALFCSIRAQDPDGAHISPPAIRQLLRRVADDAGIDRERATPHQFRHARATYMRSSPRFDGIDIEQTMGWSENTVQHARYSHVDQEEQANRILKKQGIDVPESEDDEPMECPRCGFENVPSYANACPVCTLRMTDAGNPRWFRIYRDLVEDDESDLVLQRYDDDIPPETIVELPERAFETVVGTFLTNLTEIPDKHSNWVWDNLLLNNAVEEHIEEHDFSYALSDASEEIPNHLLNSDD